MVSARYSSDLDLAVDAELRASKKKTKRRHIASLNGFEPLRICVHAGEPMPVTTLAYTLRNALSAGVFFESLQ